MKVLMVDDSAADRKLCRIWLEQSFGGSIQFSEASSGREACELYLTTPPDCVLLDYKLPDMTGLEFLRQLPVDKLAAGAPLFAIIMLTGLGNEQVAVEAMKAGAQDYLVKDRMTSASLHGSIERATEKVGLLRALQTERDRLAASLAEKETLIREVHHRVKNNLQVIVSLLRLQASAATTEDAVDALTESMHRVESMALIHDQLYGTGNLREVDMARHARSLTAHLLHSFGMAEGRIVWSVEVEPLSLPVDRAIPAGLILSELISNCLKHAFPSGRKGSVRVSGVRRGSVIVLEVRDDGVGIPGRRNENPPRSLGLEIVRILTRQLQGTIEIQNDGGALCRLTFSTT